MTIAGPGEAGAIRRRGRAGWAFVWASVLGHLLVALITTDLRPRGTTAH